MNNIDLQKLKGYFNKEKITSNKKLLVYLFFVGLSTIFWFLNALSKEYTTSINYPVYYMNFPEDKVLTNDLPPKLNLRVNAYGFDLLRYKLSTAFLSNPFDVNKYTNNRITGGSLNSYNLLTSNIAERIEKELSTGIRLEDISPDTIRFQFSPIMEKKVPVVLDLKLNFEQQFMKGGVITPEFDSVLVKGPQSLLDSIHIAKSQLLELSGLKKNMKKDVGFEKIEGVSFSPKKLTVSIPVERFTEASKNVAIKVDNLPDSVLLRLFPGDVKLSYFVGMSKYENITDDHFDVRVDYLEAIQGDGNKLKVELKSSPDFVSNVRFYPQTVTFLIEKRKSVQ
ncbi:YbbR-like domain-containing protein [Marinifilum sp. D714]|uniref:YbbR-like domain-containing protein n=1 Tax=Marinifilum sp. D714 TaxID=2937523 RepID=UPI0027D03101|nr:YbbR-like domain-containing protein [Marinifilum sp. D714]MDQ2177212.1 YbbR-like domain-containing protein [Marinifilum sp. D714]